MRHLLQLNNKKGVSLVISYVLLITIAVSLSILVYNWLRFYIEPGEVKECKQGISVVIQDYECLVADGGSLNLTLKNKGLFNIDGFVLKVNDRKDADIGVYTLNATGAEINTSLIYNKKYLFNEVKGNTSDLVAITLIEVQPFIYERGEQIFCEKVSSQSIECS